MPFALVFIGLLLVVTGAKDTYREFGNELREDFTGSGNFTWWIVSLGAVGSLGYIPEFRTFSRYFMALILLSMVIANRGVFAQLTAALQQGPVTPEKSTSSTSGQSTPGTIETQQTEQKQSATDSVNTMFQSALQKVQVQNQQSSGFGNFLGLTKMFTGFF